MTTTSSDYLLGSSDSELDRLDLQAAYYRQATADVFRTAGLRPGMRVLDLGSGTGAVAVEVARLVGPAGSVQGTDSDEAAIATATDRLARSGLANVSFHQVDLRTWEPNESFDAITGRLVTMYLPDPVDTMARLSRALRPGGVIVLQEFAMSSASQLPETDLGRQCTDWLLAGFRSVGVPTDLGYALPGILRSAGLVQPVTTIASRWETGPDAVAYGLITGVLRTLSPVLAARGIVSAEVLQIDTLEERLRSAAREADAGISAPLLFSSWARTA